MPNYKITRMQVREDRPTALASSAHGSNIDAIGFNLTFLAARNPKLATEILKIYITAHSVQGADPKAHDEDFDLFADELANLISDNPDEE
jgi:hypothetical protein